MITINLGIILTIISIVSIIGGAIISLSRSYSKVAIQIAITNKEIAEIKVILRHYDTKFDTQEAYCYALSNRLTIIETKHSANHKGE